MPNILISMKDKYPDYASAIIQNPLPNCPDCSGNGEDKNGFVCICMTIYCAFMSDDDRRADLQRIMTIRQRLQSIHNGEILAR